MAVLALFVGEVELADRADEEELILELIEVVNSDDVRAEDVVVVVGGMLEIEDEVVEDVAEDVVAAVAEVAVEDGAPTEKTETVSSPSFDTKASPLPES